MAKAELAKLEDKWADSAKAVAGTSKSRRSELSWESQYVNGTNDVGTKHSRRLSLK